MITLPAHINPGQYFAVPAEKRKYIMSSLRFSRYCECEAAAQAHYVDRSWRYPDKGVFAEGNYLEALLFDESDEAIRIIQKDDPERVLSNKPSKTDAFPPSKKRLILESAADRARRQPAIMAYLEGERQRWFGCVIHGWTWWGKLDVWNEQYRRVVDLKTAASLDKKWKAVEGRNVKVEWWEAFNYARQLAIYREMVKQTTDIVPDVYLAAVTKEEMALCELLGPFGPSEALDGYISSMREDLDRIGEVISGEREPKACEQPLRCDYCREMQWITGPKPVELEYAF